MPCRIYPETDHDHTMCPGCEPLDSDLIPQLTQTENEAFLRVARARTGCFAGNPTEEYLLALQAEVYKWVGAINDRLGELYVDQKKKEDAGAA